MEGSNLAEQALANLVNQFARSMDFLRELVQNSIDAGSPRVEVAVDFTPPKEGEATGVVEIHVDDWGEGMDETIIDNQLTRLFSSTKENDLTKIGKFGIGFTSIFAILPDAVLLKTGRHGQNWELLFHADRSFEKSRIDEPVNGTKITLFKRMATEDVESFVREARWVLTYWCEHSNTPVSFWDRTQEQATASVDSEDPFAAFAAPDAANAGPRPINEPLDLDADLVHRVEDEDIEVVIGYAPAPRYGFYNGGLTLLSTTNVEALGEYGDRLAHTSFKIKYDKLEHTLTRDNVLQDANWSRGMSVVLRAASELRERLLSRTEQAVAGGEGLAAWHGYLTDECQVPEAVSFYAGWAPRAVLRGFDGTPLKLGDIQTQEQKVGCILYDPGPGSLREALASEDILLVDDLPETRALLDACYVPPLSFLSATPRIHRKADEIFVIPELVDPTGWSAQEKALLSSTQDLMDRALRYQLLDRMGKRLVLKLGNYGGPERGRRDVLALDGPEEGGVFQRPGSPWFRLPSFLRWRCLLVNRHHPFFQAQLLAGVEDLELAAYALAQALLTVERLEPEQTYRNLVDVAVERMEAP